MTNDKRIHVAVWSPYMGNVGTIRAVLNMCKGLRENDCEVDLIRVHREWIGAEAMLRENGVRLADFQGRRMFPWLPRHGIWFRISMGILSVFSFPLMWAYLQRRRPDVLLVCLLGFLPMLVLRFSPHRPKVILSVQGRPTFNLFRKFLWRNLQARADAIVALTDATAAMIRQVFGFPEGKVHQLNNPIVGEELVQRGEAPVEHPWFITKEAPIVLAIGRHTRQKDFPTLLRAFAKVRKNAACRLVILGEGEDTDILKKLIRDLEMENDVWLAGFTPNPYAFLAKADLFVLSSLWEDNPHVLLEASHLGIPIVSTDCPSGPRAFLNDGAFGELCELGNVESMAEAIGKSLSTRHRRDEGTRGAFEKSMTFTSKASLAGYMKLIHGLLAPSAQGK